MNPFTESTVARPLASPGVAETAPAQKKSRPRFVKNLRRFVKKPLRFVPRVLGTLCLAAGMGLATSLLMPGNALAVNVNSATQEQLQTVRGIGPKTARVIIEERMRGGDYESFEDLADRVKGIGPKKTTSLQSAGLTVGEGQQR